MWVVYRKEGMFAIRDRVGGSSLRVPDEAAFRRPDGRVERAVHL